MYKKNCSFNFIENRLVKTAFILEKALISTICLFIVYFKLTINDCIYFYDKFSYFSDPVKMKNLLCDIEKLVKKNSSYIFVVKKLITKIRRNLLKNTCVC